MPSGYSKPELEQCSWAWKKDVDNSFNKFFIMTETLLGTYAPIQTLNKA